MALDDTPISPSHATLAAHAMALTTPAPATGSTDTSSNGGSTAAVAAAANAAASSVPSSEQWSSWIAIIFSIAFSVGFVVIVGCLGYRVVVDGNSQLTADIIHGVLSNLVPMTLIMAAMIVGRSAAQALVLRFLGNLPGGSATSGTTGGN